VLRADRALNVRHVAVDLRARKALVVARIRLRDVEYEGIADLGSFAVDRLLQRPGDHRLRGQQGVAASIVLLRGGCHRQCGERGDGEREKSFTEHRIPQWGSR